MSLVEWLLLAVAIWLAYEQGWKRGYYVRDYLQKKKRLPTTFWRKILG